MQLNMTVLPPPSNVKILIYNMVAVHQNSSAPPLKWKSQFTIWLQFNKTVVSPLSSENPTSQYGCSLTKQYCPQPSKVKFLILNMIVFQQNSSAPSKEKIILHYVIFI